MVALTARHGGVAHRGEGERAQREQVAADRPLHGGQAGVQLAGDRLDGHVHDAGVEVPIDVFVGRAGELARVAEVFARVETGRPWLVAIEGDPGVGKTSLARRCLAGADGLRVLWARAGQAETDLDFGIVDQLLRTA